MAADSLNVFYGERRVGTLGYEAKERLYSFQYDEQWQNDPAAFDIAPLLPRNVRHHSGTDVQFFFSNLLPEGEMLEIVSRAQGVSQYEPFGLLKKIGAECAGALKILEAEAASPDGKSYNAVSTEELSARAPVESGGLLAGVGGKFRMSLAGVQDKLPALVDSKGRVFLPELGSATTHVVKSNNRRWKLFPQTAINEHFCMSLARRMGLHVPKTFLMSVPERLYVVERFDRVFKTPLEMKIDEPLCELQGEPVHRLHQIDVCQLLGLPPTQKYEEPEFQTPSGANFATVVNALCEATGEALAVKRTMIDWVIFNYLIGNSDSHSKNVSLLWRNRRWTLSPAYDLVSVAAYSDDEEKLHDFAFTIGGDTRYGWITGSSWHGFSKELDVSYRYIQTALNRMSKGIMNEARAVLAELAPQPTQDESIVLERIVKLIANHASYAEEAARTIADAARAARPRTPRPAR